MLKGIAMATKHMSAVTSTGLGGQMIRGTMLRRMSSAAPPTTGSIDDVTPFDPTQFFTDVDDAQVRSQLNKLRELEIEITSKLSSKMDAMDWSHWDSVIKYPGLVKELKNVHESMPLPDVKAVQEEFVKKAEDTFNPIIEEFEKLAVESEAEVKELEERAAEVAYMADNLKEMTVEEFLDKYPELRKGIEDDVKNNRWFVSEY